jgi:hypothetical protein
VAQLWGYELADIRREVMFQAKRLVGDNRSKRWQKRPGRWRKRPCKEAAKGYKEDGFFERAVCTDLTAWGTLPQEMYEGVIQRSLREEIERFP